MNITELRHAEEVEDMFLMHYGVPGMKWGVRKEKSSGSGRKSNSSKNANDYVSDKKRLTTGQKAAMVIVGAMVLRGGYKSFAKTNAKMSIKRLKAARKLEAKYGKAAVTQKAKGNLSRLNIINRSGQAKRLGGDSRKIGAKKLEEKIKENTWAGKAKETVKKAMSNETAKNTYVAEKAAKANKALGTKSAAKAERKAAQKQAKKEFKQSTSRRAIRQYNKATKKMASEYGKKATTAIGKANAEANVFAKQNKRYAKRQARLDAAMQKRASTMAATKNKYRSDLQKAGRRRRAASRENRAYTANASRNK